MASNQSFQNIIKTYLHFGLILGRTNNNIEKIKIKGIMRKEKDKSIELRTEERLHDIERMKTNVIKVQDSLSNVYQMLSDIQAECRSLKRVEIVSLDDFNMAEIERKSDQLSSEFQNLLELYCSCPLNQQIQSMKKIIHIGIQIKRSTGITQKEDEQLERQRQNQFQAQKNEDFKDFSSQLNTFVQMCFQERMLEEKKFYKQSSQNQIQPQRLAQVFVIKEIIEDEETQKEENLVKDTRLSQQSKNILKLSSPAQVFSETLKKQILESNSEEHKEEQQLNNKQNEQYLSDNKTQEKKPQEITTFLQLLAQVETNKERIQDFKGSSPQQDETLLLLLSQLQKSSRLMRSVSILIILRKLRKILRQFRIRIIKKLRSNQKVYSSLKLNWMKEICGKMKYLRKLDKIAFINEINTWYHTQMQSGNFSFLKKCILLKWKKNKLSKSDQSQRKNQNA